MDEDKNNIIDGDNIFISFSGGLDSSTLIYDLLQTHKLFANNVNNKIIHPIFFDYKQKHLKKEMQASRKIIKHLQKIQSNYGNILIKDIKIIKMDLTFLDNSSLMNKKLKIDEGKEDKLPNSFVAGRNILFLTYLASYGYNYLQKYNNSKFEDRIIITLANHKDDFNGYPDCRLSTIQNLENTLRCGLDKKIQIATPFVLLDKKDIIKLSNTYILKHSWSCYEGNKKPCGICKSCKLKQDAINELKNEGINI
jgi:7-cyano-7-deazaguanine synthase